MSKHSILRVGDIVTIVKGGNAGRSGRITEVTAKTCHVDGGIGYVLVSSIDTSSIRQAERKHAIEAVRVEYPACADVTWEWLRETMSEQEADGWLGID